MTSGRFSRFPTDLPPALDRVIRRCLETDPDERWQSARDLQWELESIAQAPPEALPGSRSGSRSNFPAWGLALTTLAAIALLVFWLLRFAQRPAPPPLARMNILLPEKSRALSLAVSPGRHTADPVPYGHGGYRNPYRAHELGYCSGRETVPDYQR
jgi:serine/threonine protein kinase